MEEEVSQMCNLSKGVAEKARDEVMLQSIKNLITNADVSMEKAMTMLGIPEEDKNRYREMLKQQ